MSRALPGGRFHKTHVTLPYFIPFPLNFGTLGLSSSSRAAQEPAHLAGYRHSRANCRLAGGYPVVILGLSLSESAHPNPNATRSNLAD